MPAMAEDSGKWSGLKSAYQYFLYRLVKWQQHMTMNHTNLVQDGSSQ
jgi:hypothetical protein